MRKGKEKRQGALPAAPKLALTVGLLCLTQLSPPAEAASPRSSAALAPRDAMITARSGGATVVLAGGSGPDEIQISLSADGRVYWISSAAPLEAGGGVCANPPGNPGQLSCQAAAVAGFTFNGGPGDNTVIVGKAVPAPVTLRGGSGDDLLAGGGGNDVLIGGAGENVLNGGPGDDRLYGGAGDDLLIGGPGQDVCNGGAGENAALGCEVEKNVAVSCRSLRELRMAAGPSPCARWARRHPGAIARLPSPPE
jgi:hemolysin type calcium-binding protein